MSSIIKATDRNRGIHSASFNFDDMGRNAETYLNHVRDHAKQILAQAAQEAQAIRRRAEIEGRQAAEAAVDEALNRKVAQQMQTLLPALRTAVDEIRQSKPGWLSQWETSAIRLATAIAARILRRELRSDPRIAVPLVREALELASGGGEVRVLLHPADHAALRGEVERMASEVSRLAPTQIVADPRISPGGCKVETRYGSIDQQFESQLARIEAELT
jgi:flagellar assembly protein FliH